MTDKKQGTQSPHTPTPWHWHKARSLMHLHDATNNSFARVSMPALDHVDIYSIGKYEANAEFIVRACNSHDALTAANAALVAALEILAAYPLEDFGMETKRDEYPLFGANEWQLNVGHVRAARAALKAAQVKP